MLGQVKLDEPESQQYATDDSIDMSKFLVLVYTMQLGHKTDKYVDERARKNHQANQVFNDSACGSIGQEDSLQTVTALALKFRQLLIGASAFLVLRLSRVVLQCRGTAAIVEVLQIRQLILLLLGLVIQGLLHVHD